MPSSSAQTPSHPAFVAAAGGKVNETMESQHLAIYMHSHDNTTTLTILHCLAFPPNSCSVSWPSWLPWQLYLQVSASYYETKGQVWGWLPEGVGKGSGVGLATWGSGERVRCGVVYLREKGKGSGVGLAT